MSDLMKLATRAKLLADLLLDEDHQRGCLARYNAGECECGYSQRLEDAAIQLRAHLERE